MRAQQAMSVKSGERSPGITRSCGFVHGDASRPNLRCHARQSSRRCLCRRRFKINFAKLHIVCARAKDRDCRIGVGGADCPGKSVDGTAEPPCVGELHNPVYGRRFAGSDKLKVD
jgi:hypothetical protein